MANSGSMTLSDLGPEGASVLSNLGPIQSLSQFRSTINLSEFAPQAEGGAIVANRATPEVGGLTIDQMRVLVDQALLVIDELYVHLSLKRAIHAIDPIQSLKLLRLHLERFATEQEFHNAMISIFMGLRDLHTNYILPDPYKSRVATLPFRVEEFYDGDTRRYIVTKVSAGVSDANFRVGVIPTHWNGLPIDRAVQINAQREAGSNDAARHAQGLASLTVRWMGTSLPPDEDWIIVRYLDGEVAREAKFEWRIFEPGKPASGVDALTASGPIAMHLGVDAKTEIQRRVYKLLFSPEAVAAERMMASGAAMDHTPLANVSVLPDVFPSFRDVQTKSGTFAYIRIATFNVAAEPLVEEFIRLAGMLSQNGLILDVRGNGGGNIFAGERLLQVLTPGPIQPAQFSFVSSRLVQKLCASIPDLNPWLPSIVQATEIGASFSRGFPLTPVDACNSIGQRYQGPIVLVTDASCYSTTDIFAAGFQDHGIGVILGTSDRTGAGGANVWTYDAVRSNLTTPDSPLTQLPNGATFRVALRRAIRSGRSAGDLLEDLGVTPDQSYRMTKNDVLNGNVDMIEAAAKLLASGPAAASLRVLSMTSSSYDSWTVVASTRNLNRLDVLAGDRSLMTLNIHDGTINIGVPKAAVQGALQINGYDKGELRAAVRVAMPLQS
jgi:C-terminal processing protease CtpA/Prc